MYIKELDGNTFKRMLEGGALGIRAHIKTINDHSLTTSTTIINLKFLFFS